MRRWRPHRLDSRRARIAAAAALLVPSREQEDFSLARAAAVAGYGCCCYNVLLMEILPYEERFEAHCLELFRGNQTPFFASDEYEAFASFLKAPDGPYFVVLDEGEVVGAGGYCLGAEAAFLDWGMVKRERHRQGVGALLLSYRVESIRAQSSSLPIRLNTSQHTVEFYERYGFVRTSTVADGYGQGLDRMNLVLGSPD